VANSSTVIDQRITQAIAHFSEYSNVIETFVNGLSQYTQCEIERDIIPKIINGQATLALQRLVPLDVRKEIGIFFTSARLANKVADHLAPVIKRGTKLIDIACGAGNLLLACVKHLPTGTNLEETLTIWSDLVIGYDLHKEFVRAAQLRLILLAASLHPNEIKFISKLKNYDIFKGIQARDVFAKRSVMKDAAIVVNPPFGYMPSPYDCKWAKGKIQVAAWFLEKLIFNSYPGQHIVAILPDVLRSGTRYLKWRDMISSMCASIDIEPAGRFDENTDVDVFILHAVLSSRNNFSVPWPPPNLLARGTQHVVGDFFDVHVGTVVPYRDPMEGLSRHYIHARTAPAWQILDQLSEKRQYKGKVFAPPFVVVHRTSSPSDKNRCVATIVNTKYDVAVENHLLVLLPRDKSLGSCKQMVKTFRSPETNEWFNQRIRCRHLTVAAVRDFPCHIRKYR
jgi:hypothetical protein